MIIFVLSVETPDGVFTMEADWVIACDGADRDTRNMVEAKFSGHLFQDRFLIADVVMKADFPAERWFWFDPPFHRNQSALLHKQADDVWRLRLPARLGRRSGRREEAGKYHSAGARYARETIGSSSSSGRRYISLPVAA